MLQAKNNPPVSVVVAVIESYNKGAKYSLSLQSIINTVRDHVANTTVNRQSDIINTQFVALLN